MRCEEFQERLADYLAGTLAESDAALFHAHAAECATCRADMESTGDLWRLLGAVEPEQPAPAVRARFYQSLSAYQQGLAAERRPEPKSRFGWLRTPGFQVAWSAAMLSVGLGIGYLVSSSRHQAAEVARMQEELTGMRQMVALSLMQQQSASERLRGIDWSERLNETDGQVLAALIHAVNHDSNVNVRLAAVDALRKFSGNPTVRSALDQSLARQDSPLVQIALIDLMVDTRDRGSLAALRRLVASEAANPDVKERARWGLEKLR